MSKGVSRINTFVSKKISCVRWRPVPQHVLTQATQFISGSWDDETSVDNTVDYCWDRKGMKQEECPFTYALKENSLQLWQWEDVTEDPQCLHEISVDRDVTCITYVSTELLAVATAAGDLVLYRHAGGRLQPGRRWKTLHRDRCGALPCCWVSAFDEELVTVGDDGTINLLTVSSQQPIRVLEEADSCSVHRVQHISHSNVATANMRGQIKCWDLRADQDSPTSSMTASQQQCGVTSLARHPTQYHVLASGDAEGVICIWDLRQPRFSVTELKSHSGEVSDLLFHRSAPDSLFSAAQDGSVCQWNIGTAAAASTRLINTSHHGNSKDARAAAGVASSWLTLDTTRRYLDVLSLLPAGPLPVNSLDVAEDRLVCGGDNHVLHCVSALAV